jgi:molecular chaperone DnaK (HSP70)
MTMPPIIGIDVGTTNSLMAYVDYRTGLPRLIPDRHGRVLMPSIVSFSPDGPLVGDDAKGRLAQEPGSRIFSVKRLLGRSYDEVASELADLPFITLPGDGTTRLLAGDHEITPLEVSAIVLKTLKERADAHFGEPVRRAVITVPAYFDDSQRQATRAAGRIAGLDVVHLLNEPTAAALAYGLQRRPNAVIAIYDLGGATFDISLLRVEDGVFEMLATNGHTRLGGDDFDRALADLLLEDIRGCHGTELAGDRVAAQRIRLAAEAAKVQLSSQPRTTVRMSFEDLAYHREITRVELEDRIDPFVKATLIRCQIALLDAGLTPVDVDELVLVGGSTRVPLVRRRVESLFDRSTQSRLDPDQVVAMGAAIQASILEGGRADMPRGRKRRSRGRSTDGPSPTRGLDEAEITRMIAGGRPEGGIQCS